MTRNHTPDYLHFELCRKQGFVNCGDTSRLTLVLALVVIASIAFISLPQIHDFETVWYVSHSQKDYVIITTNAIVSNSDSLTSFISHKENMGHSVLLITEDEFGSKTGQLPNGRAEKIRQWLKDNYSRLNINYVLLIGDPTPDRNDKTAIPMKMCWPEYPGLDAPTDYFYADLTGNWDYDGDERFGEANDDHGFAGGVDLNPEVFVGRIPIYNTDYAMLDSILQKTITYENDTGNIEWRKNVLLPMSFIEPDWDGAALAEQMKEEFLDLYGFNSYRMYQQDDSQFQSEANLSENSSVKKQWSANDYGMVIWYSHGGPSSASFSQNTSSDSVLFQSSFCPSLDNYHPAFTFQLSCLNGKPEDSNNLQYSILKQGGIATVSSTRETHSQSYYGYGDFDNGVPQPACIAYEYTKRLSANKSAGEALYFGKQEIDILNDPSSTNLRNLLIFNLYGDPSISLFGTPQVIACDSNGEEKTTFALGETVYVKGSGYFSANADYQVLVTKRSEVNDNSLSSTLQSSRKVASKTISENSEDSSTITAIWTVPVDASVSNNTYEIMTENHSSGTKAFVYGNGNSATLANSFSISRTIYVDINTRGKGNGTSWNNAFPDIQDAIDSASYGDKILVASGVYAPKQGLDSREASFSMKNGVQIYGGYVSGSNIRDTSKNITILSGNTGIEDSEDDNSFHVISNLNLDCSAVLDGFTIKEGNANGSHSSMRDCGGGMLNIDSSPTITDCVFSNNRAGYGGGMYNTESSPQISNCVFDSNSSDHGGGMYSIKSAPVIEDCMFTNNETTNEGGGICNFSSQTVVNDCSFTDNLARGSLHGKGGAIYNTGSTLQMNNCTFDGNIANKDGDTIYNYRSDTVVTACDIDTSSVYTG